MTKKFFLILALGIVVESCSNHDSFEDENLQAIENQIKEREKTITSEAADFKKDFLFVRKSKSTRSTEFSMTNAEIDELRNRSLKMLESYGFKANEFSEFMNEGDPRLILLGAMFVGIMENNSSKTTKMVKTRSEVVDDCLDVAQVVLCAGRALASAVGADVIHQAFTGCITKAMAKNILKGLLKKVPWVSVAFALDTFADCMGWYDSLFD